MLALKPAAATPEEAIRQQLITQADSFILNIRRFQKVAADKHATAKQLQPLFMQCRLSYKKLEWAVEYYTPDITRQVNGPPVPEAELTGPVIEPEGLQVIEALLYPKFLPGGYKELQLRLASLLQNAIIYQQYFNRAQLFNWQIFDAVKLEVYRVETLGITGFDAPLTLRSMDEAASSLGSLQNVMARYANTNAGMGLNNRFKAAIGYLRRPVSFNAFNRAVFLTAYANPLTIAITRLQQHTPMPVVKYNRLFKQDAATLFDADAVNINAYTSGPDGFATAPKIALGKKLFFDPVLSGTQLRSCASCHQPEKAFTDGMAKNTDIMGKGFISRNTPTLINAGLQPAQFYDLRALSLEDQANDVVQNKNEMHGDMQVSTGRLWRNPVYRRLFSNAFPVNGRRAIDTMEIMNALGSYIRSLTALNSRFDEYMRGSQNALNSDEVSGFNLFMGKARCATCHYMPLFNGTLPPKFRLMETEVIGTPKTKTGKVIDADLGRYGIIPLEFNRHAFKITTVRNASRTAPYMHNGVFDTLAEVIDFYDKGGGVGAGLQVPNQTLATDQLHLTIKEKSQLIAFIKSLDSR